MGCTGLGSPGQGAAGGRGRTGRVDLCLSPFTWAPGKGVSLSLRSSAVQSPPQPGWEARPRREQSGLQPLWSLGADPSLGFPERWLREQPHTRRPCAPEERPGPPLPVCSLTAMGRGGGLDFCLEPTAGARVASLWGTSPVGSTPRPPAPPPRVPAPDPHRDAPSVSLGVTRPGPRAPRGSGHPGPGLDSQASAGTRRGFI